MHKPFAPYAIVDPMIGADSGYAFGGFIFEEDAVPISRTHFESHCDGIRKISTTQQLTTSMDGSRFLLKISIQSTL